MIKKKINTDLFLKLNIVDQNGEAIDMTRITNLVVMIIRRNTVIKVKQQYTLSDNVLSLQWSSSENTQLGIFSIRLEWDSVNSNSETNMIHSIFDKTPAFEIVDETSEEDLTDTTSTSSIISYAIDGMSAYQIAVKNGYVGTEAQWLETLKQPAVDAAKTLTDIESIIETSESTRNKAESDRVTAESLRVTAETSRAESESKRVTAESSRVTAETVRVDAENNRATAEKSRVEAEKSRTDAESYRVTSESAREESESARKSSETDRAKSETSRFDAESVRVTNENARKDAETARENSEASRVSAETSRVSAESSRVSAEASRVSAETSRESASKDAVDNANAAKDAANAAANKFDSAIVQSEGTNTDKVVSQNVFTNLALKERGRWQGMSFAVECKSNISFVQGVPKTLELWITDDNNYPTNNKYYIYNSIYSDATRLFLYKYINSNTTLFSCSAFFEKNETLGNYLGITHYVFAYDGSYMYIYVNGVFIKSIKQVTAFDNNLLTLTFRNIANLYYRNIRTYNYALAQSDVDLLYNQGRANDVVIGSELKISPSAINWNDSSAPVWVAGYNLSCLTSANGQLNVNYTKTSGNNYGSIYTDLGSINTGKYRLKLTYKSNIVLKAYIGTSFGNINQPLLSIPTSTDFTDLILDFIPSSSTYRCLQLFLTSDASGNISYTIKNITLSTLNCTDEFIPKNLCADKWINSGTNAVDMALSSPVFTSLPPFLDNQTGSGAPSAVPTAVGQKYFDITNSYLYMSQSKPNTRKFALADWRVLAKESLFIDMWNNLCGTYGKYNATTGYYEIGDVVNLSYVEALKIYSNRPLGIYLQSAMIKNLNRAIIIQNNDDGYNLADCKYMAAYSSNLETFVNVGVYPMFASINRAFINCSKLKSIYGRIYPSNISERAFYGCSSLVFVQIVNLSSNISFESSPLLSYDSIKFLIDNQLNSTTAITVTVHATTYGYLTGTATDDAYTATGHTKAEWMAIVTSGTAKALTFASA